MSKHGPLPPEAPINHCDPKLLGVETTEELPMLEKVLGHPRALRALELGSEVTRTGFSIFVSGRSDSG